MIEFIANFIRPLLYLRPIRRVRRNHGLEHATIHILSRRVKGNMAGRAVVDGYYVYGNLETQDIFDAAQEALDLMRDGKHVLAIHPNCGTGLVTTGFMTSLAVMLATLGTSRKSILSMATALPRMIVLSMVALVLSQPVGISLQKHITTLGDPGNLELVDINRQEIRFPFTKNPVVVHRVWTNNG